MKLDLCIIIIVHTHMTSHARVIIISLFLKVAGTFKKVGSRASSAICKGGGLRLVVDVVGYVEIINSLNCNPVMDSSWQLY